MAGSTRTRMASETSQFLYSAPSQEREVMDIRQAAEYLGISSDSLYKYASEGFIPAFKLGNRWRFKRSLLESWMERQSNAGDPPKVASVKASQKKPAARAR
jgi:excisionase family DNA binding protein